MSNFFYGSNSTDDYSEYCAKVFAAENIFWISSYITIVFARELTKDQMDIWGNIFSSVGTGLSALAVLYPDPPESTTDSTTNNNNCTNT